MLNFHDVRLRIFWNTLYFMFQQFWLEIAYLGLYFDEFWWKIGKNVKIKYSNPQKAHSWRKTRLLNVDRWRFICGATCRRAEENKKEKNKKTPKQ